MTEAEQQCENWTGYELHLLRCSRFVYKCTCGQAVDKKEKDRHDAEQHSSSTCKNCGKTDLAYLLSKHDCPTPPRVCEFCEGTFLFDLYEEHVDMCGSKTNQCEKCKRYVRLRDLKAHVEAGNCELQAQESTDDLGDTNSDFRSVPRNRDDQSFRSVQSRRKEEGKKEEPAPRAVNGPKKPRTFLIYHTSTKVIRPKRVGGVNRVDGQEGTFVSQYSSVDMSRSRPPHPVDPLSSMRQAGRYPPVPGTQKPKGLRTAPAFQPEDLDEEAQFQEALKRSQIEL